jgi:hypothetical protein
VVRFGLKNLDTDCLIVGDQALVQNADVEKFCGILTIHYMNFDVTQTLALNTTNFPSSKSAALFCKVYQCKAPILR